MSELLVLLAGELRLQLRQPLALLLMVLLPIAVVPGGLVGSEAYMASLLEADAEPRSGERSALQIAATEDFAAWIEAGDALEVVEGALAERGELADGAPLAEVELDAPKVRVRYRSDVARSRTARSRIRSVVKRRSRALIDAALQDAGHDVTSATLLQTEVVDVAPPDAVGGDRLGAILPGLLLFTMLISCVYTALDLITGEKERGTAETLLSTGVDRRAVVGAKALVAMGVTAISGWVGLAALGAAHASGRLDLAHIVGDSGAAALGPAALGVLAFVVGLLAVQLSGVCLVLAAWSPDYRTGSMLSAPLMLAVLVPAGLPMLPAIELTPLLALVPIANVGLACREGLAGALSPGLAVLVLGATALHGAAALFAAWRLLDREESLLAKSGGSGRRQLGFTGTEALALYGTAVLLLWFFGQMAQSLHLIGGMVFTQVGLFAALSLGAVAWLGLPVRRTLSLRRPRALDLLLAVLAGVTAPALGIAVSIAQEPLLPMPSSLLEQMAELMAPDQPLWVPLVVFALLPGLCEEILFRGAILGLLERTLGRHGRIWVVGALFGAFHMVLPRMLPTAAIGVLLGYAAVRSRSLWPAVVLHAIHNATLITTARTLGGSDAEVSAWLLVAGAGAALLCVALMGRSLQADEPAATSEAARGPR